MPDLAQGYSANVVLNAGESVRVSTTGQATVTSAYGAPTGTTTLNATSQTFGPYQVPAKLRVTAVSGTANYAQPTQVPVTVDQSTNTVLPPGAVSGAGIVAAPSTLDGSNVATYNGAQVSLAAGGTMTVSDAAWAGLTGALTIHVGQSGTATLAFSGTATKENSSGSSATSVTLAASGVYVLLQSPTGTPKFRLTGGASL